MRTHDTKKPRSTPRLGLLLAVCLATVAFLGFLTWLMGTYFPDFPNF